MIFNLEELESPELKSDACIIGGGAAGITLARKLGSLGHDVILAEGGSLKYEQQSQDLYQGKVVGDQYYDLMATRLRFFGGATNHWAGHYAPLHSYDFTNKVPGIQTAWPIDYSAFNSYIDKAREIFPFRQITPSKPVLDGMFEKIDHITSPSPARFGPKFVDEIKASQNIRLILHANLTGVEHTDGNITKAIFKDFLNKSLKISAKHFVLACGGIENPRLLLHLNETLNTNFGNKSGLLGKKFTEHPMGNIGQFIITNQSNYDALNFRKEDIFEVDPHSDFFQPSEQFFKKHKTLNFFMAMVRPSEPEPEVHNQIMNDLLCTAPSLGEKISSRLLKKQLQCYGTILTSQEQEPIEDNRIALGEEKDQFGIRRPILYWRRTSTDREHIKKIAIEFARLLAEKDIARIKLYDWVVDSSLPVKTRRPGGHHHIGATRMSDGEESGVVDTNCLLYGTENFYVAGSSVFPSIGTASPTLPLVAMTLRLADHLNQQLIA